MLVNLPLIILAAPVLVVVAAVCIRSSARRWPGNDGGGSAQSGS